MGRILNHLPNAMSISRCLMAVLIFYFILIRYFTPAYALFLLAVATDALDGTLAKKYGWQSKLGEKYLDI